MKQTGQNRKIAVEFAKCSTMASTIAGIIATQILTMRNSVSNIVNNFVEYPMMTAAMQASFL